MRFSVITALLALFLITQPVLAKPYTIGPGDVLDICVWKNPDLTRKVAVLPDGTIHLPLLNEVKAGGLCVRELEEQVHARLVKYVTDPVVTVSVFQVNAMAVYVIGKVNHPGRFSLHANIDVLQALAMAGGLNPFATEDDIAIFRKTNGSTRIFGFDYQSVSKGKALEQNITLNAGDVIVVR